MENATIVVPCPFCAKSSEVSVPLSGYKAWQSGEFIQNAMPDVSADDRELLISGTCSECWDSMFLSDEEE
jgi:hypothetical protein